MTSALLLLALALHAPTDTTTAGPVAMPVGVTRPAPEDTVRRRPRAVEVGEWYERRLRLHRYGSYAMYPLFVLEAVAGNQLFDDPRNGATWAKTGHRVGATGLAFVFGLNTVTGLWNLWDSRDVERGRGRRTVHALLMLASDAGFTYAGARLSEQAEQSEEKRREHRNLAYASMGTALTGVAVMILWPEN